MPAPPEVLNADRFVGRIEVYRQFYIEQQRHPQGHVGIAAKVKVELQGIGQRGYPAF